MTLPITNRQLIESREAIQSLGKVSGPKIPASLTFGIKRALRAIKTALEDFNDANRSLVEGHAEVDPKTGEKVILDNGNYKIADTTALIRAVDELLDQSIDLDIKTKLSGKAFGDPMPLTPNELDLLDWLIQDDFD